MKKFNAKQQKWLKCFHLIFAAVWVSCGIVILAFVPVSAGIDNADQLYMLNYLTDFIDMIILVPAAVMTLLTGLLYSSCTVWGFFKHRWLVFKWIVTVSIIITGTIFTGPWIAEMVQMAKTDGMAVLQNAHYVSISRSQVVIGCCMNFTLIFTVFVSVFKPWKRK